MFVSSERLYISYSTIFTRLLYQNNLKFKDKSPRQTGDRWTVLYAINVKEKSPYACWRVTVVTATVAMAFIPTATVARRFT